MANGESWALYPQIETTLKTTVSKYSEMCLCMHLSKIFEMLVNELTSR